jgi:hypothetical protein
MSWSLRAFQNQRVRLSVSGAVVVFCVLWVAVSIIVLSVDLPFWDQWQFVAMLADYRAGDMNLADLIAQHNEHRPLFPRLIWLALALATDYNTKAELWTNVAIAGLTLTGFLAYTRWAWSSTQRQSIPLYQFVPLVTLLTINMVQWESWLLGFQTVMFLGIFAVITGFVMAARYANWLGFAAAICLGIVATYSMANALLYWPIGLLLLLTLPNLPKKGVKVGLWIAISLAVSLSFLYGWTSPHVRPDRIAAMNPVIYGHWILNFLGAPILAYSPAFVFGILSLALLISICFELRETLLSREALPYCAIILFTFGSGILIAVGRSRGGAGLALAPRYVTMTTWYWAALFALWSFVGNGQRWRQGILAGLAFVLFLSSLGGAVSGYKWRYLRTRPAYEAVRAGEIPDDETLIAIYSEIEPNELRERIEFLCEEGWSACRQTTPAPLNTH